MGVDVLQSKEQNRIARETLRARRLDFTSSWAITKLRRVGLVPGVSVGDTLKSWDLLNAIEFIEKTIPKDFAILDIGAYASELLCALHRLGYCNLSGLDLNPKLDQMPLSDTIKYKVGNFNNMPFPDQSFDVVTAISVIEHGFQERALLSELFRVLRPRGFFVASVDYWPTKLDTGNIRPFGMDWCIFSEEELRRFTAQAGTFGFQPVGAMNFSVAKPAIKWRRLNYTFALILLQKVQKS